MPRSSTHFREESSKNKGNRSKSNQLEHSIYQHIVWMGSHLPIALMSWYRFSLHGPQKVAVLGHGHQAEASTVPVGKRSTQGPKAPRPQDPAWPSVAAVLAAFSKNHSGAPGPQRCGAHRWGESPAGSAGIIIKWIETMETTSTSIVLNPTSNHFTYIYIV
jgi:hypothetical protein